jgi:hypothetical protein
VQDGARIVANLLWILASRADRHKTIIFIEEIEKAFPDLSAPASPPQGFSPNRYRKFIDL